MKNSSTNKNLLFSLIVFFVALVVTFILLVDNKNDTYKYLFLLPLTFGILNVTCCRLYSYKNNIAIILLLLFEFFRLVGTPLFMLIGDYHSAMPATTYPVMTSSILLMIYEAIVVFIAALLSAKITASDFNKIRIRPRLSFNAINIILFVLLAFLLFVVIFAPRSVPHFKSIFQMRESDFTTWTGLTASSLTLGSLDRALSTLFSMAFSFVRYLLPISIMLTIKNRFGQSWLAVIISSVFIVLQMFFITSTIFESFLCALVLFVALAKCFPYKRIALINFGIISFAVLVIAYFAFRFLVKNSNIEAYDFASFLSENSIAYASGVSNVAGMFNLSSENKWSYLFFDLYGAIPFNNSLFGLTGEKLQAAFNSANGRTDGHIPPTIGACYYYFGPVLAPIGSLVFTLLGIKFGKKASLEKNIWKYSVYVLCAIMMIMGFTSYNIAIVLNYSTTLLIPLIVFSLFSNGDIFQEDTFVRRRALCLKEF